MISLQLQKPIKQKVWGWPAAANFIFGGTGAGLYLVSFCQALLREGSASFFESLPFGLISFVMIIIGFLVLGIEAGRPSRCCYVFCNPGQSWISRETYTYCIFILFALLDHVLPYLPIRLLAVTTALGILVSHGFIIYRSRAVTAWNLPIIPIVFLTSSLAAGYGLLLLVTALSGVYPDQSMVIIGLLYTGLNLSIWFVFLFWPHSTHFFSATKTLRHSYFLVLNLGLGHILPLLLLLFLILFKRLIIESAPALMVAICGILLFIGCIGQKAGIIHLAGYLRAIEIGY